MQNGHTLTVNSRFNPTAVILCFGAVVALAGVACGSGKDGDSDRSGTDSAGGVGPARGTNGGAEGPRGTGTGSWEATAAAGASGVNPVDAPPMRSGGSGGSFPERLAPGSGGFPGGAGGGPAGGELESCQPLDMSAWNPPRYVSARRADVCTTAEIAQYYEECLSGRDCTRFEASGPSADCGACLEPSLPTDEIWGPVLLLRSPPSYVHTSNTAGCIELVGEPECAAKIQAEDVCARVACTEPCSLDGSIAFAAYQECTEVARQTVCAEYQEAAVCIADPQHSAACSGSGGFETLFVSLAAVFCGAE